MLSVLIFDFDGIIVDTEPLHYRAFQKILEPIGLGYSWEEYVERYMGYDDRDAFHEAYTAGGRVIGHGELEELISRKAAAFQEIIADGVTPYPGVVDLIRSAAGTLPLGLCSGALACDIEPILGMLGINGVFDVMVTAEQVTASKPDPASYSLAVELLRMKFPGLHIRPENCLAVEDTPAGIASANGAGVRVLAVTNSYPAANLERAICVLDSLADVTLETLHKLF